jgi:alpha-glucosidase
MEAALPSYAWPNYVLGNHDGPRLASRFGGQAQARVAAMMLLTLRGTPTLYYGDELGIENVQIPPERIQDPPGKILGPGHSRDRGRTPMMWDASPFAGFSTVEPWLPLSPDRATRNVATMAGDGRSVYNLYRRLLWYRRRSPALSRGSYRSLDAGEHCYAYLREAEDEKRLVVLNFAGEQRCFKMPGGGTGRIVLSTYLDRAESVSLSNLVLRAHEGVILEV